MSLIITISIIYYRLLLSPLFININIKQVYRHTHLTKTFWDHEFLMDFVLENGFYLWSKSVENFGQPGCFSDPLPSSRTRTTPQNDSQGLPTGGITRSFVLGRSFPFSEVSWGCWRTFWTELWIYFSQHVDTCLMFERPFKSWFALFRRVILSATKNGALIVLFSYMPFPQPRHALSCVHQVMETSKELIGWSIRKMKGRKLVNKNLVLPSACFWHLW